MLLQFGIPKDAPAFFALHALMGEGLSFGVETIKAIRAIALRHTPEPGRAAALAARAIAAGLHPDDEGLKELMRSLSGLPVDEAVEVSDRISVRQSERHTGSDPGKDHDHETERDDGKDPGRDADDGTPSESGGSDSGQHNQPGQGGQHHTGSTGFVKVECHDELELQKVLESVFMDLSSRAASDPGFAALARRGPDGRGWLCVPYRFSLDAVDFSGFFRIVFNYATSTVERLVAEIDSSGLTRVLDVSLGPGGKPLLRYRPGSPVEGDAFIRKFGTSMKVELVQSMEAVDLIDAFHKDVDNHA